MDVRCIVKKAGVLVWDIARQQDVFSSELPVEGPGEK